MNLAWEKGNSVIHTLGEARRAIRCESIEGLEGACLGLFYNEVRADEGISPEEELRLPDRMLLGPKAKAKLREWGFKVAEATTEVNLSVSDETLRSKIMEVVQGHLEGLLTHTQHGQHATFAWLRPNIENYLRQVGFALDVVSPWQHEAATVWAIHLTKGQESV